jgi:histidinol phosphatase-like enzyme
VHGALPTPEEIRQRGKKDPRYLLPDAQFRYERTLEPPTLDEGFTSIEERRFLRQPDGASGRAVIIDLDDLIGQGTPVLDWRDVQIEQTRREILLRRRGAGWLLFVHAWRPQIERRGTTREDVDACFSRLQELLGAEVEVACCPHDAGPPVCWCRKPIPGSVLELASRRGVALTQSIVVGSSAADRTMAERIGARFEPSESFYRT